MTANRTGRNRILLAAQGLAFSFMLGWISMFVIGVFDYLPYAANHALEFIPYTPIWTPQNFNLILSHFGLSFEIWLEYRLVTSILLALVFWSVGLLIFIRNRNNWFGLYIGVLFVLFGTVSGDPLTAFSGLHPELAWLLTPFGVLAWLGLFILLFLFPNGRFIPSWTRWIAVLLLLVYGVGILAFGANTPATPLVLIIFSLVGVGAISQVYRYRRVSDAFERQQTKWVMYALLVTFVVLIFSLLPLLIPESLSPGSPTNWLPLVIANLPSYFLTLIPLSVAFAIFRYRLWDIDLIIRRTLSYGVITAILALIYLGGVTLFQQILTSLTGQKSPAAVVLSTLLIAALFTPLRRRVQTTIDRRFYRRKYDAIRALEEFSAVARSEVELEVIGSRLATAVQESLEPESVSLWLKKQEVNR